MKPPPKRQHPKPEPAQRDAGAAMKTWRVTRVWRNVEAVEAIEAQSLTIHAPSDHAFVHRDIDDIETRRRDFMADEPDLYAYIEARVAARELKRAGGEASGATDNYGAANRVWALGGQWEQKWRAMLPIRTTGGVVHAPIERAKCAPDCNWLQTRQHAEGCQQ